MKGALRRRAYHIVEKDIGPIARWLDAFTIMLIVLNMITMAAATVASIEAQYARWLFGFEVFSVGIFTLEYISRLWVCVEDPRSRSQTPLMGRLRYIITPMALIDLGAILPFYLSALLPYDFRFLLLIRLLKLLRYMASMEVLVAAVRSERKVLGSAGIIMLVLLMTQSSLMYLVEHEAQPDQFSSIPASMWWAVVTLTTVGYGDVVPITPLGRVLGGITTVLGFGMFALPAGILASAFAQEVKKRDFVVTWNMVAKVPLFSHLKAGDIAEIAALLRPQVVAPGERLVSKGDPANAMYFIVSGEVQVALQPKPKRLRTGEFFGEIGLISKAARTATVTAVTSCQLLLLEAGHFHALLEAQPELNRLMQEIARQRLAELQQQITIDKKPLV